MRIDFKAMQTAFTGVKVVTAATALAPCDLIVHATPAVATYIVTLPKVADAFYFPYTITTPTNAAGNVTVNAAEGANVFTASLQNAGDTLVVIPDGETWRVVGNESLEYLLTFTESAGAATYAASVPIPAGFTVEEVELIPLVVWNTATSATFQAGDTTDPDGFWTAVDVKAQTAYTAVSMLKADTGSGAYKGAAKAYTASSVFTASVTTVGTTGDTGRTNVLVKLKRTACNVIAATKTLTA